MARHAARALYRDRLVSVDEASLASLPEGAAVVFLMNHRSNMDYLLVSYLVAEQTALSYAVYDRTLEDRTLLLDLDPAATRPGFGGAALSAGAFVLKNLLLMARNRWHRFGYAGVNLGAPRSLRAWLDGKGVDPRALSPEERKPLVEELASGLMGAIGAVVPVLPVPLVATAFVRDPGRAFTELELKGAVLGLVAQLERVGAKVHVPRRDLDYAISVGLRMLVLRKAVDGMDGLLRARPEEAALLWYYAGSIEHLFPASAEELPPPSLAESVSKR